MILDYTPPSAWMGLEHFLSWLIITKRPKVYVEVGVHHGFSYFCACQTFKAIDNPGAVCIGVDTWQGDQHTGYTEYGSSEVIWATVNARNEALYREFSVLKRMTSLEAAKEFNDRSVDILHIDAGHSYEDIKSDFFAWLPKMKLGGVILIHDIVCHGPGLGVNEFWNEVNQFFPSFHIPYSYGLGVLTIDRYPTE